MVAVHHPALEASRRTLRVIWWCWWLSELALDILFTDIDHTLNIRPADRINRRYRRQRTAQPPVSTSAAAVGGQSPATAPTAP